MGGRLVDDGEDLDLPKRWAEHAQRGELLSVNGWRRANASALTHARNTRRAEARVRGVAARIAGQAFAYTPLNKLRLESPVIAGFRYLAWAADRPL